MLKLATALKTSLPSSPSPTTSPSLSPASSPNSICSIVGALASICVAISCSVSCLVGTWGDDGGGLLGCSGVFLAPRRPRLKVGEAILVVVLIRSNIPAAALVADDTACPVACRSCSRGGGSSARFSLASNWAWYFRRKRPAIDRNSSTVLGPAPNKSTRTRRSVFSKI